MKLLIGGSPCTHWSIAQTKNRETKPSGIGWELFLNYRIARDKYQPDYFLYENNKSMSAAIREKITEELGVEPVLINSALVSAQSRQRLYWVGKRNPDGTYSRVKVEQPEDRGILLRDILETGGANGSAPLMRIQEATKKGYVDIHPGECVDLAIPNSRTRRGRAMKDKSHCLMTSCDFYEYCGTLGSPLYPIYGGASDFYTFCSGRINVKGKIFPVKLRNDRDIIRKLTVTECKRLQTVPDTYAFPVSDTQAYKMLGNGWTVDVIDHIMSHFTGLTEGPVEVLSMYDGMSCGHIALDKLGAEITVYYATEIDKYAIQTTQHNYPKTVQLGNAFQVRDEDWRLESL